MPQLHESILPTQMEVIKESIKDLNGIKQSSSGESGVDVNTQSGDRDDDVDSRTSLYNPALLDSSRVLLFVITNETRSLAPMTLAAHCIGLMYNVVLCVQMLPEFCIIGNDRVSLLFTVNQYTYIGKRYSKSLRKISYVSSWEYFPCIMRYFSNDERLKKYQTKTYLAQEELCHPQLIVLTSLLENIVDRSIIIKNSYK